MVIVQLLGGLGNQLFQYALGRHLALKNATELKLDISEFTHYKLHAYGLHNFHITQNIATRQEVNSLKFGTDNHLIASAGNMINKVSFRLIQKSIARRSTFIEEPGFSFYPEILQKSGEIYLRGYWQSEKYFSAIREILCDDLRVAVAPDQQNAELISEIQQGCSASLHVRRGDYVADPASSKLYASCSPEYYQQAVAMVKGSYPDVRFFIFSDDPDWAETNLKISNSRVVRCNDASKNFADLRLMSLCHHNIIANSTFSWWGAWLNNNPDKIVIAPKSWFNGGQMPTGDLIPERWKRI